MHRTWILRHMTLLVIRLTHSHPLPPLGYLQVTDPDLRSAPCLLPPTIIQHESCRSVLTTTALSSVCWYHPLAASVLFCHMHAIVHDKNRGGRASAVPLATLQCCTTHLQNRCLQELLRSRSYGGWSRWFTNSWMSSKSGYTHAIIENEVVLPPTASWEVATDGSSQGSC